MITIKNMERIKSMNYVLCALLVVLGVVSRFIDHAPNFTPILSIAIMSSMYIKNRWVFLIPISIMFISDLFIGSHIMAPWIYFSILIICLLAYSAKNNISNIFLYSIVGSIIFFIISNFGVWLSGGYTHSLEGLILCYTMAIPFFKNTLMSTSLFSVLIFVLYNTINLIVKRRKSDKILDY